jgi:hypothetical protein
LTNVSENAFYTYTGSHQNQTGKNDSSVEMVYITNNTDLDYIPSFGSKFRNLTGLGITLCNLKNLYEHDLISYPNLRWISLRGNKIENIPGNFFTYTPSMETIFFYDNKIKSVGRNLLSSLNNLTYASFMDNVCTSRVASTPNDLQWLIFYLSVDCPEEETQTSPTETPTTESPVNSTTSNPPTCKGSISERICNLETQNQILLGRNQDLSSMLDDVNRKLDMISENLFGFTQIQQAILMSLPVDNIKYFESERTEAFNVEQAELEINDES